MAEISVSESRANRPWILTFMGLIGIGGLLALPFAGLYEDAEVMPELAKFIGHFHPLVLHLPIGVFILVLLQEFGACFRCRPAEPHVGFPMAFGVWSSIAAVLAGFLLWRSGGADYDGNDLAQRHLWGGVVFTCAVIVTAVLRKWVGVMQWHPMCYKLPLAASVAIMGFTSHDGASMTHGSDFLTKHAPTPLKKMLGIEVGEGTGPSEDPLVYADLIEPIFERRCVACHKEGKSKGKLRMDAYEHLMKGGKTGPALVVGDPEGSLIVTRIMLPLDDEEHMPPKGKPQMEPEELKVVEWWIREGAKKDVRLANVTLPAEIEPIVAKLIKLPPAKPQSVELPVSSGHVEPSKELQELLSSLTTKYPGTLYFESQKSTAVVMSAVSLRSKLGDGEFAAFAPVVPHLVSADLTATSISDQSVAVLEGAEQLRSLRLGQTKITDEAIDHLASLIALETLNLYGTEVTDDGLMKLIGLPNLQRLYLWQTKVTAQGVAQFTSQMPTTEIILGGE